MLDELQTNSLVTPVAADYKPPETVHQWLGLAPLAVGSMAQSEME